MADSEFRDMVLAALEQIEERQWEQHQLILVVCCGLGVIAGLLLIRILMDRM